jgi:ABC-type multidrug transport system ATPase subunit
MQSDHCTEQPLLELKNVSFYYDKNQEILKEVNFKLLSGERIGIIGHNGSGKSTITKLLLGLYKPQKGTVNLFGRKVSWETHYPSVGYIGDPSYNPGELGLPNGITVEEVIQTFKKLWVDFVDKSSLDELVEQLEIAGLYRTDVGKISKGERMRLMAFLALGKKPQLLIADEATEGLDIDGEEIVVSAVENAAISDNITMLWISHRRDEVARLTDEVYRLEQGNLVRQDSQNFDCEFAPILSLLVSFSLSRTLVAKYTIFLPYASPFTRLLPENIYHFGTAAIIGFLLLSLHCILKFRYSVVKNIID